MKKVTIQPAPQNFEEVLERITDSGQAVFTSPVDSEEDFAEMQKSVRSFIRRDKENQQHQNVKSDEVASKEVSHDCYHNPS